MTAFVEALRRRGATVQTGRFRAMMLVESVNVGPRTVILDVGDDRPADEIAGSVVSKL